MNDSFDDTEVLSQMGATYDQSPTNEFNDETVGSLDGLRVSVNLKNGVQACGVVRYDGYTNFGRPGSRWVGVELDDQLGKNNGTLFGYEYFRCKHKHGVFVQRKSITSIAKREEFFLPGNDDNLNTSLQEIDYLSDSNQRYVDTPLLAKTMPVTSQRENMGNQETPSKLSSSMFQVPSQSTQSPARGNETKRNLHFNPVPAAVTALVEGNSALRRQMKVVQHRCTTVDAKLGDMKQLFAQKISEAQGLLTDVIAGTWDKTHEESEKQVVSLQNKIALMEDKLHLAHQKIDLLQREKEGEIEDNELIEKVNDETALRLKQEMLVAHLEKENTDLKQQNSDLIEQLDLRTASEKELTDMVFSLRAALANEKQVRAELQQCLDCLTQKVDETLASTPPCDDSAPPLQSHISGELSPDQQPLLFSDEEEENGSTTTNPPPSATTNLPPTTTNPPTTTTTNSPNPETADMEEVTNRTLCISNARSSGMVEHQPSAPGNSDNPLADESETEPISSIDEPDVAGMATEPINSVDEPDTTEHPLSIESLQ
eukprot:GCRY01003240.1.p1 GENE.GCRY01003240.1~~GCRY01003240.1.p1  ORF type:complete len:542 (+),score=99.89 GCRY01003240.1:146-1771(+)